MTNKSKAYEYFAFISYKREDEKWAKKLQKKLESYSMPTAIRKENPELPNKIRPVFRDQSELSGGNLKAEIEKGLNGSKYLIVICSPRSARSPWVSKEVQHFIDQGREDSIIPFIIGGTPFATNPEDECFPEGLRQLKGEKEILGININEMGRDAATIKVIARMFNLRFDALWQRFEKQKHKRIITWGLIALILIFFLCGVAAHIASKNIELSIANHTIKAERDRASQERDRANSERERAERINDELAVALDSISYQSNTIQQANNNLNRLNNQLIKTNSLLLSSQIGNIGENGNAVFTIYNRGTDEISLWAYDSSDNLSFELPYAIPFGEYSISKDGRYVSYWDIRNGFDAILIYDIDNHSLTNRIQVADNYSLFKFVKNRLVYSIDAGIYIYNPIDGSQLDLPNYLNACNKGNLYDEFTISDDNKILAITQWIDETKPTVRIFYLKKAQIFYTLEKSNLSEEAINKEITDNIRDTYELELPNGKVKDIKINDNSSYVAITYLESPLVSVVDLAQKSIANDTIGESGGVINWIDDSRLRIDCNVRSYKKVIIP